MRRGLGKRLLHSRRVYAQRRGVLPYEALVEKPARETVQIVSFEGLEVARMDLNLFGQIRQVAALRQTGPSQHRSQCFHAATGVLAAIIQHARKCPAYV